MEDIQDKDRETLEELIAGAKEAISKLEWAIFRGEKLHFLLKHAGLAEEYTKDICKKLYKFMRENYDERDAKQALVDFVSFLYGVKDKDRLMEVLKSQELENQLFETLNKEEFKQYYKEIVKGET